MSKYNAIKINKGPSGFGGPLTLKKKMYYFI